VIEYVFLNVFDRCRAVARNRNGVTLGLEEYLQDLPDALFIVNNQYFAF
jgi:hypothetical protein